MYLLEGTAGTQCLATSAPFPFRTRTDLVSKLEIVDHFEINEIKDSKYKILEAVLTQVAGE